MTIPQLQILQKLKQELFHVVILDVNDPELLGSASSDVRNDADSKLNNSLSFNMTVCVRTANCNNWCTFPGLAVQI